jgi:tetratricopeptide (TPR) repeat protein
MTVAEKLAKALEYREKGNGFFKAGAYKKALLQYARVHAYMHCLVADESMAQYQQAARVLPPTEAEKQAIKDMQVATYSNMGICDLKLKQPQKAMVNLDKALQMAPTHGKALCNKGRAFIAMKDLDRAKDCLQEAQLLHPDDALIRKELDRLPALYKKQEEKEKGMWKRAFGGGGGGGSGSSGGGGGAGGGGGEEDGTAAKTDAGGEQ